LETSRAGSLSIAGCFSIRAGFFASSVVSAGAGRGGGGRALTTDDAKKLARIEKQPAIDIDPARENFK
jgi:hypothetical protein